MNQHIVTNETAWRNHCKLHHEEHAMYDATIYSSQESADEAEGVMSGTPVIESDQEEEYYEQEECREPSNTEVMNAINELKDAVKLMSLTLTGVKASVDGTPSTKPKVATMKASSTTFSTPIPKKKGVSKPDHVPIQFEGIAQGNQVPHGKIKLAGDKTYRVVYENKNKLTYYSPKRDSGELVARTMSQTQLERMEMLTDVELNHLGFEA